MNCCVCGAKLSFFQGSAYIRYNGKQYPLCERCTKERIRIQNGKTANERAVAIEYFKGFIERGAVANSDCKVALLQLFSETEAATEELRKAEQQIEFNREWLNNIMLTTGHTFAGYEIVEYKGLLNASVVLGTGFLSEISAEIADTLGTESELFSQKIEKAKESTQNKLKEKALSISANAIIGIDYDIFTVGYNMIGVSINGTAVKIERCVQNTPVTEIE